jgi:aminopeptidase N
MLEKIKSVLTRTPPTFPPAPAAQASTPDAVWKTKAKVESLRAEVEAARLTLAQAEQAVGDRLVEGLDVTAATDTMKQAGDRVRVLESALAVAIQKDEAAQAELKQAERQMASDAEDAASARVLARAAEGEAILKTVRRFALDLAADQQVLGEIRKKNGTERSAANVGVIPGQLMFFLRLAIDPGTGTEFRPYGLRTYDSWTECLEKVCGLRARDGQR